MNILFSLDHNYIPVFSYCLRSILHNGGADHYDFYLLHSDLSEEDQKRIEAMAPDHTFHFMYVDPAMFDGFPITDRYPAQIYYRLAAPMLLPELDRILYLDGDIAVINPLDSLYNMDFDGCDLIGCSHTGAILNSVNQIRLGMDQSLPYINSGVLLFNLPSMKKHLSMEAIQDYAKRYDSRLILMDQDILTALYGKLVKVADWRKYNLSEKTWVQNNLDPTKEHINKDWIRRNTVIVHYCGRNKPWKKNYSGKLGDFFYQAVGGKMFVSVGGEDRRMLRLTCKNLMREIPGCVWLDASWCWRSDPLIVNDSTRRIMQDNARYMLRNYLNEPSYPVVIFSWNRTDLDDALQIIHSLDLNDVQTQSVLLTGKKAAAILDPEAPESGHPFQAAVEKARSRFSFPAKFRQKAIAIRTQTSTEVASQILDILGLKENGTIL